MTITTDSYHVDVGCVQLSKFGAQVCGDVFLSRKIKEEERTIVAVSDGLGSGVKANVLATLTASMAVNFTLAKQPVERTARIIMQTLPVDQKRQISYATFTIADVEGSGETRIIEFDNPGWILVRNTKIVEIDKQELFIDLNDGRKRKMLLSQFKLQRDDRIVLVSDGVTQSGIGTARMPFGYGEDALKRYVCKLVKENSGISAYELARDIISKSNANDIYKPQDDITCAVIHFRNPRKLLICSGPPFNESRDKQLAEQIMSFDGRKIICGGTTSLIVSRELGIPIRVGLSIDSSGLPPISHMEGVDLVTEGILTIGKVAEILETLQDTEVYDTGPAAEIVKQMFQSDIIYLLVGTKINVAHQDPSLPVELEIRRNVMRKIARLLEDKFLKKVEIQFI
ncbi:SpoIIE family protein phosphatase [Tenuifilum thalassicum]|uniref:SpoIIE family protein phosphatase n=1 Tax=Tenuifilum thalassicum TaxID=2590900 RepID=A0A7D3Y3U3_9BACT|nr:SpoIIE family protein phosphatase [Tenuifilum thalassicum]QKG79549.1 SpoIIE family protein phosphatase [Tenuifilum thalassicum]